MAAPYGIMILGYVS